MKKFLIIIILALTVAASGVFWLQQQKQALPLHPVRLAINPWPGYEYLYLAEQKGFFKEEGLNILLKQFSSLEDVRLAFEQSKIDGMCSTLIEILQVWANTGKIARIALISDYSNGGDVILARDPIKNPTHLKGKKIGVEPMALGAFILQRALEKHGLSQQDVTVLGYGLLQMNDALIKGEIDAIVSYPPASIEIEKRKDINRIFDTTEIPKEVLDVVSFNPDLLDRYPAFLPALRRAWDKALAYAQAHPDDANAIMAAREGISTKEFVKALSRIKVLSTADQDEIINSGQLKEDISHTADVLKGSRAIKEDFQVETDLFIQQAGRKK